MSWEKYISEIKSQLNNEVSKLKQFLPSSQKQQALSAFIRPELGATPPVLRKIFEPLIAVSAITALILLLGLGTFGITTLFFAASLIYVIITRIFGIELDLDPSFMGK